jgi:hypothetical protein
VHEQRVSDSIPGDPPRAGALKLPYQATAGSPKGIGNEGPLSISEVVRPDTVLRQLGAVEIDLGTGFTGKQDIQPSRVGWGWQDPQLVEIVNETVLEFAAANLQPREVSSKVLLSRRVLKSSQAEGVVREAFAIALREAYETAALAGEGRNGVPQGLLNIAADAGIHRSPRVGAVPTWTEALAAAQLAIDGGCPVSRLGWCLSDADYAAALAVERPGGKPMIRDHDDGTFSLGGRPLRFSPHLPAGHAIVGDWRQVVIAYQGAPGLIVNPFSRANYAQTEITIFQNVDVICRRPHHFTIIEAA